MCVCVCVCVCVFKYIYIYIYIYIYQPERGSQKNKKNKNKICWHISLDSNKLRLNILHASLHSMHPLIHRTYACVNCNKCKLPSCLFLPCIFSRFSLSASRLTFSFFGTPPFTSSVKSNINIDLLDTDISYKHPWSQSEEIADVSPAPHWWFFHPSPNFFFFFF